MVEKKIQEDLAVIKQIMLESRQSFYNVGIHLIVWSGIAVISLLYFNTNHFIKYQNNFYIYAIFYIICKINVLLVINIIHRRKY